MARPSEPKRVLEQACLLLRERELCDWCLGRQFDRLGHGLSNRERGRAIRILLHMEEGLPLEEPEVCQLCLGELERLEVWAERALEKLEPEEGLEFRSFLVGSRLPEFLERAEAELRERFGLESGGSLRHELNREVGKLLERKLAERGRRVELDLRHPEVTVILDLVMDRVELKIAPLFIYGRYRKLIRGIPQTRWPCRRCRGRGCPRCNFTGKMYPESVEELIAPVLLGAARGKKAAFHGAGREDIDARMLGSGRPFVVEIREPRVRSLDLEALKREINAQAAGKVEVEQLQLVERRMVEHLKNAHAAKRYRARVELAEPVPPARFQEALAGLRGVISQRTPQRVAHRRADKVREREVYEISGRLLDGKEVEIELLCEGGLYVKELVSGDEGRTHPSLSELLGIPARVTELDVLEVLGDFP